MLPCSVASLARDLFIFVVFLSLFLASVVSAVPRPILPPHPLLLDKSNDTPASDLLHTVAFAVPCFDCFPGAADAALPFELVHDSTISQCDNISLTLNGHQFVYDFGDTTASTLVTVAAANRTVDLNIQGYCDQNQTAATSRQVLFFDLDSLDGKLIDNPPSFTVLLDTSSRQALVVPHPRPDTQCLSLRNEVQVTSALFSTTQDSSSNDYESQASNPQNESNSAEDPPIRDLRARFIEEKKLIKRLTMDCRKDFVNDLRECKHDLTCSSKAICSHLHDAIVNLVANIKSSLHQSPLVSDERQWQAIVAEDQSHDYGTVAPAAIDGLPGDESPRTTKRVIALTLEILAGVLGLAGLMSLIRRHCRSFRRRAERLADREERKRAREYRRLARKEAFRKKWVAFKGVFTRLPCRKGSCEEKAALILEAADHANEGPASAADIEQVWSSISREEREFLVTLAESSNAARAYKHSDARSRSSSLPSYESEKLPKYTSQPGSGIGVTEGYRAYSPSLTASSANTAITPDSSVPDLSPRCSRETLRTLMSRD